MNYPEMENLFREEQLELHDQLRLNAGAVDLSQLKKDWLSVHTAAHVHRFGGAAGYVYAGICLTLGFLNSSDVYLYGPLLLAAVGLVLNGIFFPVQQPPVTNLERFSARELADELAGFQRYANRRIPFDCLAAGLFVAAFFVWAIHFGWGVNPLTDFDRIGPVVRTQGALALGLAIFGGLLLNYQSNRKLRKLEERLRSYQDDDQYV